jgi:hypothetical protein
MKKEYLKPELIDMNEQIGHGAGCRTGSGAVGCQAGNAATDLCGMGNGGRAT